MNVKATELVAAQKKATCFDDTATRSASTRGIRTSGEQHRVIIKFIINEEDDATESTIQQHQQKRRWTTNEIYTTRPVLLGCDGTPIGSG